MSDIKIGFDIEPIRNSDRTLNIGLIDADFLDNGTRHPNLALLKMSGYCKRLGHHVRLISNYDEIRESLMDNLEYDILAMSRVFKFTVILERLPVILSVSEGSVNRRK